MATKNLYEAEIVAHNEVEGQDPIVYTSVYVLAKSPSQVNSRLIRELGDKLLFIECITFVGSNDSSVIDLQNTRVKQLIG